MRVVGVIFLAVLVTGTKGSSLLEMSQTMWSKLLEGGLTKIGALDPLTVPIVKVDQSEGNTSYRMILRGLEIVGLNASSLESVHIARGRLKTNLSEHEAGYVSYTDQRELDTIRYRFHTVTKEPKNDASRDLRVQPMAASDASMTNQDQYGRVRNYDTSKVNENDRSSSRYQNDRTRTYSRYQDDRSGASSRSEEGRNDARGSHGIRLNYETSRIPEDQSRYHSQSQNSQKTSDNFQIHYTGPHRQDSSASVASSRFSVDREGVKNPGRVRIVYAEKQKNPQDDYETKTQRPVSADAPDCGGSCAYGRTPGYSGTRDNRRDEGQHNGRHENPGFSASMDFASRRAYVEAGGNHRHREDSAKGQNRRNDGPANDDRYAASFERKVDKTDNRGLYQRREDESSGGRLENKAGYVDIVYADDKDHKMRRFGNLNVEPGRDKTVYSLDDVMRDLRDHKRFIIHNFTEGEALTKKNDAARTASETRRIKDLVRYAREFQEMQGYYEQGMQLIFHYGDDDADNIKVKDGKRTKRAHLDDETDEDDIMHVIMRIRVPMLQVNAGYVLMGKVGKQVLRGNGLLAGNFTELIGDFTLELKKLDEDTMIVRAARARLSAKDKKITLQGMDEEGPVKHVLTHGLMAAEAVAAMLADDLATKALSEKTADSIIYRMYKNLPSPN